MKLIHTKLYNQFKSLCDKETNTMTGSNFGKAFMSSIQPFKVKKYMAKIDEIVDLLESQFFTYIK